MTRGLYTAAQGMLYETLRMDVIANNLANAATPGYKQDRIGINASFPTLLEQAFQGLEVPEPPLHASEPPRILYTIYATDFSQGRLRHTENPLDLALDGPGFFVVQHPNGTIRYTRDGHFLLDANGWLKTPTGWNVLGQNGPIQISGGSIRFGDRGEVMVDGQLIDTLQIVDVPQQIQPTREGGNLFAMPAGSKGGLAPAQTLVRQGYLEESNVDIIREMVRMITALRNYESYQKTIQSIDTSIGQVNELGRG